MKSLRDVGGKLWPGATVIPIMDTGASDSIYTMNAGIPSFGISDAFYDGLEFYYLLLKEPTRPSG